MDFPPPEGPTKATVDPDTMFSVSPRRAQSSLPWYLNHTSFISTELPLVVVEEDEEDEDDGWGSASRGLVVVVLLGLLAALGSFKSVFAAGSLPPAPTTSAIRSIAPTAFPISPKDPANEARPTDKNKL